MMNCTNRRMSTQSMSSEDHDQAGACVSNVNLPFPHLVRSQTGVCRVRPDWLWVRWPGTPAVVYNPGTQAENTQVNVTVQETITAWCLATGSDQERLTNQVHLNLGQNIYFRPRTDQPIRTLFSLSKPTTMMNETQTSSSFWVSLVI